MGFFVVFCFVDLLYEAPAWELALRTWEQVGKAYSSPQFSTLLYE
jgi:hypothetical protein